MEAAGAQVVEDASAGWGREAAGVEAVVQHLTAAVVVVVVVVAAAVVVVVVVAAAAAVVGAVVVVVVIVVVLGWGTDDSDENENT